MNILLTQLKEYLQGANHITLIIHRHPDGDCLGSSLARGALLEKQGKHVTYFCPTPPSSMFNFLPTIQKFSTTYTYEKYDLCIFLDSANPLYMCRKFRVGYEEYFSKQTIINVDHHISNNEYGQLNIIDPTASSTCELITEIFQKLYPDEMDADIATYLLMGIMTDTGNFLYDTDSIRTFSAVTYLLKKGADKNILTKKLYRSSSYEQIKSLGLLLKRMDKQGKIIFSRYNTDDLKTNHIDKEQIEGFLPLMTSIEHDGIFVLFKNSMSDLNPTLRCSLRANNENYNVSEVAQHFNGGGHIAAAGCSIPIEQDFQTSMQTMLNTMNEIIK